MSPRRVGALVTGSDPRSKTIWIVDVFDTEGEITFKMFVQRNSDYFGRLICFVDIEEKAENLDSDFDEYMRMNRLVEKKVGEIFEKMFGAESKIIDLDMRIEGRKVRCCCCAG